MRYTNRKYIALTTGWVTLLLLSHGCSAKRVEWVGKAQSAGSTRKAATIRTKTGCTLTLRWRMQPAVGKYYPHFTSVTSDGSEYRYFDRNDSKLKVYSLTQGRNIWASSKLPYYVCQSTDKFRSSGDSLTGVLWAPRRHEAILVSETRDGSSKFALVGGDGSTKRHLFSGAEDAGWWDQDTLYLVKFDDKTYKTGLVLVRKSTGATVRSIADSLSDVERCHMSPNRRYAVLSGYAGEDRSTALLVDLGSGKAKTVKDLSINVWMVGAKVMWSPDSQRFITSGAIYESWSGRKVSGSHLPKSNRGEQYVGWLDDSTALVGWEEPVEPDFAPGWGLRCVNVNSAGKARTIVSPEEKINLTPIQLLRNGNVACEMSLGELRVFELSVPASLRH